MTKIKQIFSGIRWWEAMFLLAYFIIEIVLGVVFKSPILVVLNVLTSPVATFLLAKGKVLGSMLMLINLSFYFVNCFLNRFYGEIIFCVCISFPLTIITIVLWFKNLNQHTKLVIVNNKFSWKEWVTIIAITPFAICGIYYLLRFFNTANLVFSTICSILNLLASYLQMRRNEYSFLLFAFSSIVTLVLWTTTVVDGVVENIPFIINYVVLFALDTFGISNWLRMKKQQKKNAEELILKICKEKI